MSRKRRLLAGLAALLALALSVPLLSGTELLQRWARAALETELGQRVESGGFSWQVLPWPGVVARRVRLPEDPAFGHEPFLYAEEVQGRLDLRRLVTGELRLAEVRLVSPSINLVRNADQGWNLASFLLTPDP
ncbi:MAG: AsmA family protein, partial [Terriglobia bacterium]